MFVSRQLLDFLSLTDREANAFHRGLAAVHEVVLKIEPRCGDQQQPVQPPPVRVRDQSFDRDVYSSVETGRLLTVP